MEERRCVLVCAAGPSPAPLHKACIMAVLPESVPSFVNHAVQLIHVKITVFYQYTAAPACFVSLRPLLSRKFVQF